MNKKLIIINIILLVFLFSTYILGYYLLSYPMNFDLWYLIRECQLEYLIVALLIIALISGLVSSLDIKKLSFRNKFLSIFPILGFLFLIFLVYRSTSEFISIKEEITKRENKYIKQAEQDIKNDNIIIKFAGGLAIPRYDKKTLQEIDNIQKKYGITYYNTGCVVDPVDSKAQEKYDDAVKPYLEKRNGKGWEEKMNKEIESLEKISFGSK